jgi:hypothetical protein
MNTQFLNSQIHKEMNKKETKCATLNHLRLKLFTLKTSMLMNTMPKLIIYWLWYKTRAAAEWLPLLALYLIQG